MPALGYEKCIHLMNPMVPGLTGAKMSSSDPDSKIDLLTSPLRSRPRSARRSEEGNIERNGIFPFVKHVLFSLFELKGIQAFVVERPERFGGNVAFCTYDKLGGSFAAKELFPLDLKNAVSKYLNQLLEPIRLTFRSSPELVRLTQQAYPDDFAKNMSSLALGSKKADFSRLVVKVGKIVEIAPGTPRPTPCTLKGSTLASPRGRAQSSAGLVKYIPIEQLANRKLLLPSQPQAINAARHRVLEQGMLMAAEKDGVVEPIDPPRMPMSATASVCGVV